MLRFLFYAVIVRFVVLVVLGLNVRHRERLPRRGPAILAPNHNSHLDAMVLVTLMPLRLLSRVRPVAAADYFMRNALVRWFSLSVLGIIPIKRRRDSPDEDLLAPVAAALARGDVVVFFPEGSRGEPEQLAEFKSGLARLAERHPLVPVVPVYTHGLGKSLPRGEWVFVPFFVDVFVGEALHYGGDRTRFMQEYAARMDALAAQGSFAPWN